MNPEVKVGVGVSIGVDWAALRRRAADALAFAYAPYSGFPVGAAAMVDDGRIVTGANVENASFGLTLCAECALISALHMTGGGKIVAFACVDSRGRVLMPCGRCRQLLVEHAARGMLCDTVRGVRKIEEVLPNAFGPSDLTGGTVDNAGQSSLPSVLGEPR